MRPTWWIAMATLAACRTGSPPPSPSAEPVAAGAQPLQVRISQPFQPVRSDSALRAFLPAIPLADSAGECRLTRSAGSGATTVTVGFPSIRGSKNNVTLSFDSAGHLVRYFDTRGAFRVVISPGMTDAQRDSARREIFERSPMTSVSLDWSTDQALAANRTGKGTDAVIGSVRDMENLDKLGPPTKRIVHVRRLCGV